jgi:hypothetical protein
MSDDVIHEIDELDAWRRDRLLAFSTPPFFPRAGRQRRSIRLASRPLRN